MNALKRSTTPRGVQVIIQADFNLLDATTASSDVLYLIVASAPTEDNITILGASLGLVSQDVVTDSDNNIVYHNTANVNGSITLTQAQLSKLV